MSEPAVARLQAFVSQTIAQYCLAASEVGAPQQNADWSIEADSLVCAQNSITFPHCFCEAPFKGLRKIVGT
jgi:hypothetical protein